MTIFNGSLAATPRRVLVTAAFGRDMIAPCNGLRSRVLPLDTGRLPLHGTAFRPLYTARCLSGC